VRRWWEEPKLRLYQPPITSLRELDTEYLKPVSAENPTSLACAVKTQFEIDTIQKAESDPTNRSKTQQAYVGHSCLGKAIMQELKDGILSDDEELGFEIGSEGESDNASADDTNSSGSSTNDGDVPFMSDASMVTSTADEVSMASSIIPDDHAVGFDDEEYEDLLVWEYVEDEEEQPRKRVIVSPLMLETRLTQQNRDCECCFTCPHCNQSNRVLAADRHAVPATLDETSTPILIDITTTTDDHITSILDKPAPDLDDTSRDGQPIDVPEFDVIAPDPLSLGSESRTRLSNDEPRVQAYGLVACSFFFIKTSWTARRHIAIHATGVMWSRSTIDSKVLFVRQ